MQDGYLLTGTRSDWDPVSKDYYCCIAFARKFGFERGTVLTELPRWPGCSLPRASSLRHSSSNPPPSLPLLIIHPTSPRPKPPLRDRIHLTLVSVHLLTLELPEHTGYFSHQDVVNMPSMFKRKSQQPTVSPLPAPDAPRASIGSMSSMASQQQQQRQGSWGAPAERVMSNMSIGTMDSSNTLKGDKRRSGGFLGFGRKRDKDQPIVEEVRQIPLGPSVSLGLAIDLALLLTDTTAACISSSVIHCQRTDEPVPPAWRPSTAAATRSLCPEQRSCRPSEAR